MIGDVDLTRWSGKVGLGKVAGVTVMNDHMLHACMYLDSKQGTSIGSSACVGTVCEVPPNNR